MPWKSSEPATPCWMLLMTASSAFLCSVSLSSRCVSSKRRAFSRATVMLVASVCSRRRSDSVNACSRSMSMRLMSPRTWSPATSGTYTADFSIRVPGSTLLPNRRTWPAMSSWMSRGSRVRTTCAVNPVPPSGLESIWMRWPPSYV